MTDRIPEWELNAAEWFYARKEIFRRMVLFLLFMADLFLVYQLGLKLVDVQASGFMWRRLITGMAAPNPIAWNDFQLAFSPRALIVTESGLLNAGSEMYDLYARVANTNEAWGARGGMVRFSINGTDIFSQPFVLLPREHRYIFAFNIPAASVDGQIVAGIEQARWVPADEAYYNIDKSELTVSPPQVSSTAGSTRVSFVAANASPYSLWQAGFTVVAFAGNRLVAGYYTALDDWESGTARTVSLQWPRSLPPGVRVEISPELDVFDQLNIKALSSYHADPPGIEKNN